MITATAINPPIRSSNEGMSAPSALHDHAKVSVRTNGVQIMAPGYPWNTHRASVGMIDLVFTRKVSGLRRLKWLCTLTASVALMLAGGALPHVSIPRVTLNSGRSWPAFGLAGAQRRAEQTLAARWSRAPVGDSRARNAA